MVLLVCRSCSITDIYRSRQQAFSERTNASSHNARYIFGVPPFTARQVTFFLQSIRNRQGILTKGVKELAHGGDIGGQRLGNITGVSPEGDTRIPYAPCLFFTGH